MTGTALAFLAIPEALALALIATAAGRRICSRLLPDATPLETSVFGFPVGMGLLSILMTGLLFGKVPGIPFVLGAVLIGAAAWARADMVEVLGDLRDFARESPILAALIGASALLGLIGCLAPETGWDTGVYHFAMARLRAEQGVMVVRMDVPHGYRPAALGMLHTAGFVLNGETLASLINLAFYFAGLALARLWGLRLAGPRGGLFASMAWLSSITYMLRMDGGDVEVTQAVYLGVALLSLIRIRDGGALRWRLLAGLALGILVGLKYASSYAVLVAAVLWVLIRLRDRAPLSSLLSDGAVIGVLCLLVACPWYVRNRLETGSWFFPYGMSVVGGGGAGPIETAAASHVLRSVGMDGFILAGLLALGIPALSRDRWTGIVALGLVVCMLKISGWSTINISNLLRYASPAWLPLLVYGGAGAAWLAARGPVARTAAGAAMVAALAVGQGVLAARNLPKFPAAAGIASRDEYLIRRVSTYAALRRAESDLAAGKRILLVEERVYYCRAPFLGASDIQSVVDFDKIGGEPDLRRFLEAESIGAIVVDRADGAKIWHFRNMERRLGASWPPPGVTEVPVAGNASYYRIK